MLCCLNANGAILAGAVYSATSPAPRLLAGALLRLQRLDNEEARGETEVYASQSGEARAGRIAGAMALEQLPLLFSRRG